MQIRKCTLGALFGLLVGTAVAQPLAAQVVTYTDAGAFTAAAGPPAWVVDFETYTSDVSFANSAVDVGPLSISAALPGNYPNYIDVVPFAEPHTAQFGNALMAGYVDNEGPIIDFLFDSPVTGFFADFLYAGNTRPLDLYLMFTDGSTSTLQVPGIGNGLQPFGFTSAMGVTQIRMTNNVNDGFYVDNILGVGGDAVVTTPEPATLGLMALGLFGLVGFRRGVRKT